MQDTITRRLTDVTSLDTAFALLSNRRRSHAVAALADRETPVHLEELGAAVASREADEGPEPTTTQVATTLHHVHLPKLDAAGVVNYDAEAKVVTPLEARVIADFQDALEADA